VNSFGFPSSDFAALKIVSQLPKLQPTRTIKSNVNLKKHTLKLKPDKPRVLLPGQAPRFRLSFEVDALEPCR
jgi:hypothetical protein